MELARNLISNVRVECWPGSDCVQIQAPEMGSRGGGNYGDDKVDFGIHLDVLLKVRNVFRVSVFVCYLSLNIAKHIPENVLNFCRNHCWWWWWWSRVEGWVCCYKPPFSELLLSCLNCRVLCSFECEIVFCKGHERAAATVQCVYSTGQVNLNSDKVLCHTHFSTKSLNNHHHHFPIN